MPDSTGSVVAGSIMWVVIFYPMWSPRLRRKRKQRKAGARRSTVSRNHRQAGPSWEQDAPYPECFDQEDDL